MTTGHDTGSGLIHFGARYYQPSTGRWTQPDPLDQPGDLGQQNVYLYVANDPVNGVDPSGLQGARLSCSSKPQPKGQQKAYTRCARGGLTDAHKAICIGGAALGGFLAGGPVGAIGGAEAGFLCDKA